MYFDQYFFYTYTSIFRLPCSTNRSRMSGGKPTAANRFVSHQMRRHSRRIDDSTPSASGKHASNSVLFSIMWYSSLSVVVVVVAIRVQCTAPGSDYCGALVNSIPNPKAHVKRKTTEAPRNE